MSEKLVLPVLPPSPDEVRYKEKYRDKARLRRLERCVNRYEIFHYAKRSTIQQIAAYIVVFFIIFYLFDLVARSFGQVQGLRFSIALMIAVSLLPLLYLSSDSFRRFGSFLGPEYRRARAAGYDELLNDQEMLILLRLCRAIKRGPFAIKLPNAEDVLNTPSSPLTSPVSFVRLLRQYNGIKRKKGRRR